ncbi:Ig-like domain-containing protein [Marinobacter xestospongiae]|nr:Ig-like domain-containing protein [Marinobacter xestospongiae]
MCYDFSKLSGTLAKLPQFAVLVQGMREMYSRNSESGETMMSGKFLARASAFSLTLFLAACGGGDGSSPLNGGPGNGDGDQPDVGSIQLLASPVSIGSSEASTSDLTVLVKDNKGVLMNGVDVEFSSTNAGTLQVERGTTDESGTAIATLSPTGDPRNRTVEVKAIAGRLSDSVDIEISGTALSISGPSSIAFGDSASYRIQLTDSDGNGIANQAVNLSSNSQLETSSLTTDANGTIDVTLNAGTTGGTDTLRASAFSGDATVSAAKTISISSDQFEIVSPAANTEVLLNTPQTITMRWLENGTPVADGRIVSFSATRGTLSPTNGLAQVANGQASIQVRSANAGPSTITATDQTSGLSTNVMIEFVATTPDTLNLQATKTQVGLGESTEVIATVRDPENNLVKNQVVTFQIKEDGSNGSLSTSTDVTDSQGKARVIYTGGGTGSGRDGVTIIANVGTNISDQVNLTVAKQALRLAIGTGNQIEEPDTVRYIKSYLAVVTDSNGAPIDGAEVELSVLPVRYRKGEYLATTDGWVPIATPTQAERDAAEASGEPLEPLNPVECAAEDSNGNGVLDAGEDFNGSGSLEPTNSASTNTPRVNTESDGTATFDLVYPQSHCTWVRVRLTATVRVEGTESVETSEFYLSCLADDLNDTDVEAPGGKYSLYGNARSCSNPN